MSNYNKNSEITPPKLTGERCYLRRGTLNDFEALKRYRQDPENSRYIRLPDTDEQTMAIVLQLTNPWVLEEGRWNGLVLCLKGDDTAVGELAFYIESWEHQRAEIGYRLDKSAEGKGICTEAASVLINFLFTELKLNKIVAKCDPRNVASSRVMEKLGMVKEAEFKQHFLLGDEWTDQDDYGLLRDNWQRG